MRTRLTSRVRRIPNVTIDARSSRRKTLVVNEGDVSSKRRKPTFYGWFLVANIVLMIFGAVTSQWAFAGVMLGLSIMAAGMAAGNKLLR